MKKVITICILAITLLAGGMTMDAKTTKKTTKAKTTQSSSNVASLLKQYENAVDALDVYYDEDSGNLEGWGSDFSRLCNREETLYRKLKKLESSMTSDQKSKFNKLARSLNIR